MRCDLIKPTMAQPFSALVVVSMLLMSMMKRTSSLSVGRVVVVGSANQDLTSYSKLLPQLGETVMGERFSTSCGGKGANQANAAASLGIAPVSMVCKVGNDVFAETLLKNFDRKNVEYDPSHVHSADTSTGVATIVVDTKSGDNMIIVAPGANHALSPEDVTEQLEALQPKVVVVQLEILYESALQALKTAKAVGATTILNPAPAPEDYDLSEFMKYTDLLIPNESELRTLCKKPPDDETCDEETLAKSLLEKGVGKAVIVTLGARGAMVVENDQTTLVSAPDDLPCKNDPVLDTIGAGDGFCGSLASYLSADVTLQEAAKLACGFAGMSVRRNGASYPSGDEIPECLKIGKSGLSARKPTLTFVTGNKKKLEEVQQILGQDDLPFEIVSQKIELPELQGEPEDIAKEKCRLAAAKIKGPCMTEDTSLCFNALNGMPGPYIKWFLEKCGHDGLNKMLDGFEDRSAYAQTIVAFSNGDDSEVLVFDGRTQGKIVPPRGKLDFGWDPIFEPDEGKGKTYAEMSSDEKNAISHRGRSFAKLRTFLKKVSY